MTDDAKRECTNPGCRRINGECVGYHCPHCGDPVGPQGHDCPDRASEGDR